MHVSVDTRELTIREHLRELKRKIVISLIGVIAASIVSFIFYDKLFSLLYLPFSYINERGGMVNDSLYMNFLFEGFLTRIKISVIFGLILSFPVHSYTFLSFIYPGLKGREKKIVLYTLISSFLLITGSVYYGYYKIIPICIEFLTSSTFIPEQIGVLLNYSENIFYILKFILICLLIFQTPILLLIMLYFNLIERKSVLKASKYVVLFIFLLSALITPPDFISQVAIALPLVSLFFLTILVAKIFHFGDGLQ